jgi:MerR family mercuric resistance operon transcriptional regulator
MKMTISQVARLAGVGVETVRFYEREGLLDQPARPGNGYRDYPKEAVKRIQFIRRAKELGFSLKEISELLTLSGEPMSSCAEVKRQAEAKIDEIEGKIADLLRMKRALGQIAERCSGDGPRERCPILDTLERDP